MLFSPSGATIGLQSQQITEGEVEQVCAVLTVPADGSERTLNVTFAVDDGTKAGTVKHNVKTKHDVKLLIYHYQYSSVCLC